MCTRSMEDSPPLRARLAVAIFVALASTTGALASTDDPMVEHIADSAVAAAIAADSS